MNDFTPLATTRQAAEILGVHESSIKRWNTSKQLNAQQTSGGHRRFSITEILDFAKKNRLDSPLLFYGSYAERVWTGIEELRKKNDYTILIQLVYEWILDDRTTFVSRLLIHVVRKEYPLEDVIDNLLAEVLYQVGENYMKGMLAIGDEHRATHSLRDVLIHLKEQLRELGYARPARNRPITILGCGREEKHELGALMARLVLEVQGWTVVYLGLDVPTEEFAKQQAQHEAALVCISMMPPRGERDVHHIFNLLDRVYDRRHPYRLAFGGGAVSDIENFKVHGSIPEVRIFRTMKEFSYWIQKIAD
ncbi:MAG: cobalamin-dependent protein [Rhodothermaceae bacterium]|nr:cobalamin-dependent protein [Rhodothermaceae bacterium]